MCYRLIRVVYGVYVLWWYVRWRDVHTGFVFFLFQAEDGIRDLVRSRGLGDVYKRQVETAADLREHFRLPGIGASQARFFRDKLAMRTRARQMGCLLYTSDAADERSSVDLGGRRILKKKKNKKVKKTRKKIKKKNIKSN